MKIDLSKLDEEGMYRFLERLGMLCGTGPASQDEQQEALRSCVTVPGTTEPESSGDNLREQRMEVREDGQSVNGLG